MTAPVLLLHGHGRTGASMALFALALRARGHPVFAPSYGFRRSLPEILDSLGPRVSAFASRHPAPLGMLTHSLGGLVARALIAAAGPGARRIGRVVMLAPPNQGSELADLLDRLGLAAPLLGPVAPHLGTRCPPALGRLLGGPADYPLGIIAGSRAVGPVPPGLVFDGPNDGKVTVAATHLAGEADHLVLPVSHPQMLVDGRVRAQALHFLAHGRFRR